MYIATRFIARRAYFISSSPIFHIRGFSDGLTYQMVKLVGDSQVHHLPQELEFSAQSSSECIHIGIDHITCTIEINTNGARAIKTADANNGFFTGSVFYGKLGNKNIFKVIITVNGSSFKTTNGIKVKSR